MHARDNLTPSNILTQSHSHFLFPLFVFIKPALSFVVSVLNEHIFLFQVRPDMVLGPPVPGRKVGKIL